MAANLAILYDLNSYYIYTVLALCNHPKKWGMKAEIQAPEAEHCSEDKLTDMSYW